MAGAGTAEPNNAIHSHQWIDPSAVAVAAVVVFSIPQLRAGCVRAIFSWRRSFLAVQVHARLLLLDSLEEPSAQVRAGAGLKHAHAKVSGAAFLSLS